MCSVNDKYINVFAYRVYKHIIMQLCIFVHVMSCVAIETECTKLVHL